MYLLRKSNQVCQHAPYKLLKRISVTNHPHTTIHIPQVHQALPPRQLLAPSKTSGTSKSRETPPQPVSMKTVDVIFNCRTAGPAIPEPVQHSHSLEVNTSKIQSSALIWPVSLLYLEAGQCSSSPECNPQAHWLIFKTPFFTFLPEG